MQDIEYIFILIRMPPPICLATDIIMGLRMKFQYKYLYNHQQHITAFTAADGVCASWRETLQGWFIK